MHDPGPGRQLLCKCYINQKWRTLPSTCVAGLRLGDVPHKKMVYCLNSLHQVIVPVGKAYVHERLHMQSWSPAIGAVYINLFLYTST